MFKPSPGVRPVELHSQKDDNFRRKSKQTGGGCGGFKTCLTWTFGLSFLCWLQVISSASGSQPPPSCNRTRQVLSHLQGNIEDGPGSTNYTGNPDKPKLYILSQIMKILSRE